MIMKNVEELFEIKLATRVRYAAESAMHVHNEALGLVKDLERLDKFIADFCYSAEEGPRQKGRYYRDTFSRVESETILGIVTPKQVNTVKRLERYLSKHS
jgi:hypothetical protein